MSSMIDSFGPHRYPGTNILKNLCGLTDPELLERFETRRADLDAAMFAGRAAYFTGEIQAAQSAW